MDHEKHPDSWAFLQAFAANPENGKIDQVDTAFTQDDLWRSLQITIGGIYLEPDELTARYGMGFVRDIDDLDYFLVSVLRTSTGRLIGLRRYRGAKPVTEICVNARDDAAAARAELQQMIDLPSDAFI